MYHSLNIFVDDSSDKSINTWEDWGLIPTSRPTFSMPKKKKRTIEIPGTDGVLNLSKALNELFYENRQGSFEFIVDDPYNYDDPLEFGRRQWQNLYSEIANAIHGRSVRIILEDDPGYYYIGELAVNEWKSDPKYSLITIDYEVDPYKYSLLTESQPWLWDPLSFINGVIREYGNVLIERDPPDTSVSQTNASGAIIYPSIVTKMTLMHDRTDPSELIWAPLPSSDRLVVIGGRKRQAPAISYSNADGLAFKIKKGKKPIAGDSRKIIYSNTDAPLSGSGEINITDFMFEDDEYEFTFIGSGSISIYMREGSL